MEPVVRKAIEDNQYLIENKDIRLHLDVFHDKTVRAKEEVIYIAVTNLIRNAYHFTSGVRSPLPWTRPTSVSRYGHGH